MLTAARVVEVGRRSVWDPGLGSLSVSVSAGMGEKKGLCIVPSVVFLLGRFRSPLHQGPVASGSIPRCPYLVLT